MVVQEVLVPGVQLQVFSMCPLQLQEECIFIMGKLRSIDLTP